MKKGIAFLLAVVAFVALGGVYTAFAGHWVLGKVLDISTKRGIPFAFVRIGGVWTQTDGTGNFARWLSPNAQLIVAEHPCYTPFSKFLQDVDLSAPIEITMRPVAYEDVLVQCRAFLQRQTSFVLKTESHLYEFDKDGKAIIENVGESLYVMTDWARLYLEQYSNSKNGVVSKQEAIVTGADPKRFDKVAPKDTSNPPIIYYKDTQNKDWKFFSLLDRTEFVIPTPQPNPKSVLEPLFTYGQTTEFELIPDAGKTADGAPLVGCKMYWKKDSILVGKSIQYKFKRNGDWYEITFNDTGENPASKPGNYTFTLLDIDPNIRVDVPKDAKPLENKK